MLTVDRKVKDAVILVIARLPGHNIIFVVEEFYHAHKRPVITPDHAAALNRVAGYPGNEQRDLVVAEWSHIGAQQTDNRFFCSGQAVRPRFPFRTFCSSIIAAAKSKEQRDENKNESVHDISFFL